jgi:hypothetical protein
MIDLLEQHEVQNKKCFSNEYMHERLAPLWSHYADVHLHENIP